jgi:mannose-6-phosphate isomerase-like protein (cupin superfamily)
MFDVRCSMFDVQLAPILGLTTAFRSIKLATCFMPNYLIADLAQIDPVRCPCGWARRAFASPENGVATLHVVDIQEDARAHYHKQMTEIYFVLEGEGQIELDGQLFPLKPMTAVFIKPGCRHRALGKLKIINVPIPAFDERDEWFDDPTGGR